MKRAAQQNVKIFVGKICSFVRILLLSLLTFAPRPGFTADPDSLILTRPGNLPILRTVPHGGAASVPNVPLRKTGSVLLFEQQSTLVSLKRYTDLDFPADPDFINCHFGGNAQSA